MKPQKVKRAQAAPAGETKPSKRETPGGGPQVKCAHAELVDTAALVPNDKNPNRHPDKQLTLYAKILWHQGWRKPVVVSKQSGKIVTGHGAWLTAKREGWLRVPVDYQDFATPADETAHLLADNRLPQLAETDPELLVDLMETDLKGADVELAGFVVGDAELSPAPEVKPVAPLEPPKLAWVLLNVPLATYPKIAELVEKLAQVEGVAIETTVTD